MTKHYDIIEQMKRYNLVLEAFKEIAHSLCPKCRKCKKIEQACNMIIEELKK